MQIVVGEPLSIDTIVSGIYRRYSLKLDEKGHRYIIGLEEQRPEVLILRPKAILVKYGSYLSHLAIVSREVGIPMYRVENLDSIVDGSLITVIPKDINPEIPKSYKVTIRFINKSLEDSKRYLCKISEYLMKRYGINTNYYIKSCYNNICYGNIIIYDVDLVINDIFSNPDKYISLVTQDMINRKFEHAVVMSPIAELAFKKLISKYGIDRVRKAMPPYNTIWSIVRETYFKTRFGILDKGLIETIRLLSKSNRKEYIPLDNPIDRRVLTFVYLSMVLYELKNL